MSSQITFIIGCTASGKGALGRELARRVDGEIISLDSMKIYRRMDIGTAKPSADLRRKIPHHLIDVVEPSEDFSVANYVKRAEAAIADIQERGRPVFLVGGAPLYLKALTQGLFEGPGADQAIRSRLTEEAKTVGSGGLHERLTEIDALAARRIHPNDLRRIVRALEVYELTGEPISSLQEQWDRGRTKFDYTLIGLRRDKDHQSRRTNERVGRMIEEGLVAEVQALLGQQEPLSTAARQALGYAEIIEHLEGRLTLAEAIEMIKINTRHFSKAQRTWFKRFSEAEWIDVEPDSTVTGIADSLTERYGSSWLP